METFAAPDGTRLACHLDGAGDPLVCLPGGPAQDSAYLGDLGGLSRQRRLVRLDLRGTGASAAPADPQTYRCDRMVGDVEALRVHLGADRIDLLGHSAGATLALLYALAHPGRVARLVLVCPSGRPVGLQITDADRREVAELRREEPWFADAFAAFGRIWAGEPTGADWEAITPFTYGRWDRTAREHHDRESVQINPEAAERYYADGAVDPQAVRAAALGLTAPVLLTCGEYDVALPPRDAATYAALFPRAEVVVLPRAGHFPWLDDPEAFTTAVSRLSERFR